MLLIGNGFLKPGGWREKWAERWSGVWGQGWGKCHGHLCGPQYHVVFPEASFFLSFPPLMLDFIFLGIYGQSETLLRVNYGREFLITAASSDAISSEVTNTTGRALCRTDTVRTFMLKHSVS